MLMMLVSDFLMSLRCFLLRWCSEDAFPRFWLCWVCCYGRLSATEDVFDPSEGLTECKIYGLSIPGSFCRFCLSFPLSKLQRRLCWQAIFCYSFDSQQPPTPLCDSFSSYGHPPSSVTNQKKDNEATDCCILTLLMQRRSRNH